MLDVVDLLCKWKLRNDTGFSSIKKTDNFDSGGPHPMPVRSHKLR